MNNQSNERKITFNSDFDISSNIVTELTPSALENSLGNNINLKKENNILKDIAQKEKQIFRLFYNRLGKNFLNKKPKSVLLFEKRLKKFLFSPESKFLDNFPSIQTKIKNELNKKYNMSFINKINIGPMMYYSLNNKNNKNDMITSNNKEKYLETSKNFSFVPAKDVVNSEYYKKKYIDKNIRRIKKILSNKNIRKKTFYNKAKSLKIINKNSIFNDNIKNNINKEIKKQIDDELNSISNEEKNSINNSNNNIEKDSIYFLKNTSNDISSKDNINCENNKEKILDKNNIFLNNLTERKNKRIRKTNNHVSFKLFTEKYNISSNILKKKYSFNNTPSPRDNSLTNRNNISICTNLNKNNNNLSKIKNKSRNVINIDILKKKSLSYKTSIDTNINSLDKYTNRCNSLLLKLVKKNKTKTKNFLKIYNQDKELKKILSKKVNKKFQSQYMKKRIKDEKLNKMRVLIKDSFIDYDINKLLKEKKNYDKLNRNSDIYRKYNMLSENLIFGNINNGKNSEQLLISDKERKRLIRNKRMENLRETIKINSFTINKLKNSIKIDKNKIMDFIQRNKKINNNK